MGFLKASSETSPEYWILPNFQAILNYVRSNLDDTRPRLLKLLWSFLNLPHQYPKWFRNFIKFKLRERGTVLTGIIPLPLPIRVGFGNEHALFSPLSSILITPAQKVTLLLPEPQPEIYESLIQRFRNVQLLNLDNQNNLSSKLSELEKALEPVKNDREPKLLIVTGWENLSREQAKTLDKLLTNSITANPQLSVLIITALTPNLPSHDRLVILYNREQTTETTEFESTDSVDELIRAFLVYDKVFSELKAYLFEEEVPVNFRYTGHHKLGAPAEEAVKYPENELKRMLPHIITCKLRDRYYFELLSPELPLDNFLNRLTGEQEDEKLPQALSKTLERILHSDGLEAYVSALETVIRGLKGERIWLLETLMRELLNSIRDTEESSYLLKLVTIVTLLKVVPQDILEGLNRRLKLDTNLRTVWIHLKDKPVHQIIQYLWYLVGVKFENLKLVRQQISELFKLAYQDSSPKNLNNLEFTIISDSADQELIKQAIYSPNRFLKVLGLIRLLSLEWERWIRAVVMKRMRDEPDLELRELLSLAFINFPKNTWREIYNLALNEVEPRLSCLLLSIAITMNPQAVITDLNRILVQTLKRRESLLKCNLTLQDLADLLDYLPQLQKLVILTLLKEYEYSSDERIEELLRQVLRDTSQVLTELITETEKLNLSDKQIYLLLKMIHSLGIKLNINELVKFLRSSNPMIRAKALEIAAYSEPDFVSEHVVNFLGDRSSKVRLTTINIIKALNLRDFLSTLKEIYTSRSTDVSTDERIAALSYLAQYPQENQDILIEAIESKSRKIRRIAIDSLLRLGKISIPQIMRALTKADSPEVRLDIEEALTNLDLSSEDNVQVLEYVLNGMADPAWKGLYIYETVLQRIYSKNETLRETIINRLKKLLEEDIPLENKGIILRLMGKLRTEEFIKLLPTYLEVPQLEVYLAHGLSRYTSSEPKLKELIEKLFRQIEYSKTSDHKSVYKLAKLLRLMLQSSKPEEEVEELKKLYNRLNPRGLLENFLITPTDKFTRDFLLAISELMKLSLELNELSIYRKLSFNFYKKLKNPENFSEEFRELVTELRLNFIRIALDLKMYSIVLYAYTWFPIEEPQAKVPYLRYLELCLNEVGELPIADTDLLIETFDKLTNDLERINENILKYYPELLDYILKNIKLFLKVVQPLPDTIQKLTVSLKRAYKLTDNLKSKQIILETLKLLFPEKFMDIATELLSNEIASELKLKLRAYVDKLANWLESIKT